MLKLLFAAAAVSAAAPAPIIAAIATQDIPVAVRVHVTDLDLATPAGTRRLDHRILRAAEKICEGAWNTEFTTKMQTLACRKAVIATVAEQRARAIADAAAPRVGIAAVAPQSTSGAN